MVDYMKEHTFCSCGEKVYPGQIHNCEDLGIYVVPDTDKLFCKWCKSYSQVVAKDKNYLCSCCYHIVHIYICVHGVVCNPIKITMHDPKAVLNYEKNNKENIKYESNMRSLYISEPRPNNFWLGRNIQQHTSTGTYYSSSYYKSSASLIGMSFLD